MIVNHFFLMHRCHGAERIFLMIYIVLESLYYCSLAFKPLLLQKQSGQNIKRKLLQMALGTLKLHSKYDET